MMWCQMRAATWDHPSYSVDSGPLRCFDVCSLSLWAARCLSHGGEHRLGPQGLHDLILILILVQQVLPHLEYLAQVCRVFFKKICLNPSLNR